MDFKYTYSAPTEDERKEIESIKKQYAAEPKKEDKLTELRKLDKRVNRTPLIASIVLGIAGTLVMGLGMTMSLEWNILAWGIAVGVIGIAVAATAYPVYKALLNRGKLKYGKKIIELSNELLNSDESESEKQRCEKED